MCWVIFRCQKYVKKGYIEMRKWILLVPLISAPGCSILYYFRLHLVRFCDIITNIWWDILNWVRLNYATTHHHPPPSTTTHHHPKYVHHYPPPAKIYPPLPTISQKMDHHPTKAKIYWYITSFRHCFNSFFFFEIQYFFPWWRFCLIKFWSVSFSNSKFLLHSVHFKILKIF